MKRFANKYLPVLIFSASIFTMVITSITSLADHASQPPAHSASYAVLHSPLNLFLVVPDQSRATKVSRSGPDSDLLVGVTR